MSNPHPAHPSHSFFSLPPGSSLRFYRGIGTERTVQIAERTPRHCSSVLIAARRLQVCSSLIELESFRLVVRVHLLDTSIFCHSSSFLVPDTDLGAAPETGCGVLTVAENHLNLSVFFSFFFLRAKSPARRLARIMG